MDHAARERRLLEWERRLQRSAASDTAELNLWVRGGLAPKESLVGLRGDGSTTGSLTEVLEVVKETWDPWFNSYAADEAPK